MHEEHHDEHMFMFACHPTSNTHKDGRVHLTSPQHRGLAIIRAYVTLPVGEILAFVEVLKRIFMLITRPLRIEKRPRPRYDHFLGVAGNAIYRKYQICLRSFWGISYTLQSILPSWRRMSAMRIKCMQVVYNHEQTVCNKQGQRSTHVITTHIIRAHFKIPPSLSLFTDTIKTRKMQKKKAMYTYYLQNCLNDCASKDLLHHFIASAFTVAHDREVLRSR